MRIEEVLSDFQMDFEGGLSICAHRIVFWLCIVTSVAMHLLCVCSNFILQLKHYSQNRVHYILQIAVKV